MDHFWLNEGFTVWAERRMIEALHGPEVALLGWAIGEAALSASVERFGAASPFTRLRTDLAGLDPDDAFSAIPYEKGSRFLAFLAPRLVKAAVAGRLPQGSASPAWSPPRSAIQCATP